MNLGEYLIFGTLGKALLLLRDAVKAHYQSLEEDWVGPLAAGGSLLGHDEGLFEVVDEDWVLKWEEKIAV